MKKIILITCLAALPLTSFAEGSKFGIGAKLSTLGPGFDLTYKINQKLSTRFNINGYNEDIDDTIDENANVTGKAKLSTTGILLDYHPLSNGLRLTGGIYNNRNSLDLSVSGGTGDTVDINGTSYEVSGTSLDTTIGFKSSAPYLGLGWTTRRKGLNFNIDAGVLIQGSPTVNMTTDPDAIQIEAGSGVFAGLSPAQKTDLTNNIAAEEAKINKDAKPFKHYPVLSLGIYYNF